MRNCLLASWSHIFHLFFNLNFYILWEFFSIYFVSQLIFLRESWRSQRCFKNWLFNCFSIHLFSHFLLDCNHSFRILCLFCQIWDQSFNSYLVFALLKEFYFLLIRKFNFIDWFKDNFVQTYLIVKAILQAFSLWVSKLTFIVKFQLFFQILN